MFLFCKISYVVSSEFLHIVSGLFFVLVTFISFKKQLIENIHLNTRTNRGNMLRLTIVFFSRLKVVFIV